MARKCGSVGKSGTRQGCASSSDSRSVGDRHRLPTQQRAIALKRLPARATLCIGVAYGAVGAPLAAQTPFSCDAKLREAPPDSLVVTFRTSVQSTDPDRVLPVAHAQMLSVGRLQE